MKKGPLIAVLVAAVALGVLFALDIFEEEEERRIPTAAELEGLYGPRAEIGVRGNVVYLEIEQDPAHLERGGPLWARVGPYIFLFSPQTREIFGQYDGVAAVDARTVNPAGEMIARARLHRDELTAFTWPRAHERVYRARTEGTERPRYLENLVRFGERHTDYEYNPAYVAGR